MSSARVSQLMIVCGLLMIVLPTLFVSDLTNYLPAFLVALALIIVGIVRIVRQRFFTPKAPAHPHGHGSRRGSQHENGSAVSPHAADAASETDSFAADPFDEQEESEAAANSYSRETATAERSRQPWQGSGDAAHSLRSQLGAEQRRNASVPGPSGGKTPAAAPEAQRELSPDSRPGSSPDSSPSLSPSLSLEEEIDRGLFDADPQVVRAEIVRKTQGAIIELFDIEPDLVRAALAKMLEKQLEELFDTDPDAVRLAIADLLQLEVLNLFDVDPIAVKAAINARSEQEMGELFDADPATIKEQIASLIQGVLFDIDPDEVRKTLASFGEREVLDLFDVDPEMVKAALKLQFATEILELFDADPSKLRATFAWRQDELLELFDADPEALRALWEAQKAEPLQSLREAFENDSELIDHDTRLIIVQQLELIELHSQQSLDALRFRQQQRQDRRVGAQEEPPLLFSGKISLELLRRQVVQRIVEEKITSLNIQHQAVAAIVQERQLPGSAKNQLLEELSQQLTAARTLAKQLNAEMRAEIARERLAEREAQFRSVRRPSGDLDPQLQEKLRQRMLERSRQKKDET